jgi:hypothetical protein
LIKNSYNNAMSIREIGCCGAYCKTCRAAVGEGQCRGCKLGYETGERDISKARCKIKVCCFQDRKLETCADCQDYIGCKIIHGLYEKNGYKYGKYKQSIEFIRENGYDKFLILADTWQGPYGKLP